MIGPIRATSDLHLTESSAEVVFAALDALRVDAEATGGITVLVGDIFDQPVNIHMPTWNRLREKLRNWPGTVYVVPGNHDQYGPEWHHNCLEGLAGRSCRVVTSPRWTSIGRIIPYTRPEQFTEALKCVGTAPPVGQPMLKNFVWCHHGFQGAYMNAMKRDTHGVTLDSIPPGHVIIAGHYHMPQVLGPVIYCGSPYEVSFAEEGQQKGWLRWEDPENNPLPDRIAYELSTPRHCTIRWDPSSGPPEIPPWLAPTDKVRIVATSREAANANRDQIPASLAGAPILAQTQKQTRAASVTTSSDPREATAEYVLVNFSAFSSDELHAWAAEHDLWAR